MSENQTDATKSSAASHKLKELIVKGVIGTVSLVGATAIPLVVQRFMMPPLVVQRFMTPPPAATPATIPQAVSPAAEIEELEPAAETQPSSEPAAGEVEDDDRPGNGKDRERKPPKHE
jgi:hypothetical protein